MPDLDELAAMQAELPAHLRYQRDEAVVRAEAQFSTSFRAVQQAVAQSPHIPTKALFAKYLGPLVEQQTTWLALQIADVLRYAQGALVEGAGVGVGTEAEIGIPADDAAVFVEVISDAIALLERLQESPVNKGKFLDELRESASKLVPDLHALVDAVEELAFDEEATGNEDEDEDEDEDEPLLETETDDEPVLVEATQ